MKKQQVHENDKSPHWNVESYSADDSIKLFTQVANLLPQ
jgi:hypothetical protein